MATLEDTDVCGRWMPLKKVTCAQPSAHAGACRSVSNTERSAVYYEKNRNEVRTRAARWKIEHPEYVTQYNAEYNAQYYEGTRQEVFNHFGWECSCCGSTDDPTIDHVNGDGAKHRREVFGRNTGVKFYQYLVMNDFPDDYELQTLCGPCNYSKRKGEHCTLNHDERQAA